MSCNVDARNKIAETQAIVNRYAYCALSHDTTGLFMLGRTVKTVSARSLSDLW